MKTTDSKGTACI